MNLLKERMDELLNDIVKDGPVGCACVVTQDGNELYKRMSGLADLATNKPITEETIYRIYSMTKVVTVTAALMLYERGKFLLTDPLEMYLPEFAQMQVFRTDGDNHIYQSPAKHSIQIKDLFTMTSGITYPGENNETEKLLAKKMEQLEKEGRELTTRGLSKLIASIPLAFDPGERWHYGMSHDVLGALIEAVSGQRLGDFFRKEIFNPLQMNDTSFRIREGKEEHVCTFYRIDNDGEKFADDTLDRHIQPDSLFDSGGGGLLSTLDDYSKFVQMLANGGELNGARIIGRKTIELMASDHLTDHNRHTFNWPHFKGYSYGLGVRVLVNPQAGGINGTIGEFGWPGMLGTWTLIDPKEKLSAVYMQQLLPSFEPVNHPKIRQVIYGTLE